MTQQANNKSQAWGDYQENDEKPCNPRLVKDTVYDDHVLSADIAMGARRLH